MLDMFLHGAFSTYGFEVVRWMLEEPYQRVDPLYVLFPRYLQIATFLKHAMQIFHKL